MQILAHNLTSELYDKHDDFQIIRCSKVTLRLLTCTLMQDFNSVDCRYPIIDSGIENNASNVRNSALFN